jgi:hypothetical protein
VQTLESPVVHRFISEAFNQTPCLQKKMTMQTAHHLLIFSKQSSFSQQSSYAVWRKQIAKYRGAPGWSPLWITAGTAATEEGKGEEDWIQHGSILVWVESRGFVPFPGRRLGKCCCYLWSVTPPIEKEYRIIIY